MVETRGIAARRPSLRWSIALGVSTLVAVVTAASPPAATADTTGSGGASSPAVAAGGDWALYTFADATFSIPNGNVAISVWPDSSHGHTAGFVAYLDAPTGSVRCSVAVALGSSQFAVSPDLSAGSLSLATGPAGSCSDGTSYVFPDRVTWASDPNPLGSYGDGPGPRPGASVCGASVDNYWSYVERLGTASASRGGVPSGAGRGDLGYEYGAEAGAYLPPAGSFC